jgi:hypothetical protein
VRLVGADDTDVDETEATEDVEITELKELVEICDWLETEMEEDTEGGTVELSVGGAVSRSIAVVAAVAEKIEINHADKVGMIEIDEMKSFNGQQKESHD